MLVRAGKKNSERFPPYHSLDLKIEKKWRINEVKLVTSLNIINVCNVENPREFDYGAWFMNGKLVTFPESEEFFLIEFSFRVSASFFDLFEITCNCNSTFMSRN